MKYKLLAIDLDGTTIDDNGNVPQINIEAIRKASEKGVFVVPTTGRTLHEIDPAILEEKSIEYFIFSNGSAIYRRGEGVIYKDTFDQNLVKELVDMLGEYETMIELYADGHPYADSDKLSKQSYEYFNIDPIYHSVLDDTRVGVESIKDFSRGDINVEMFNVFFKNMDERSECMERLKKIDSIDITSSMENNIEILKKNCNKGTAVTKLIDILGIDKSQAIAVGDSGNDITSL